MMLEKRFTKAIAPGQSAELHSDDEDDGENVPEDLGVLMKVFKESDSIGQILLLAVVSHSKYMKETLVKVFDCKEH